MDSKYSKIILLMKSFQSSQIRKIVIQIKFFKIFLKSMNFIFSRKKKKEKAKLNFYTTFLMFKKTS